jgi:multidrug efflux pump subunit AcrA (membrane-fusion protein)
MNKPLIKNRVMNNPLLEKNPMKSISMFLILIIAGLFLAACGGIPSAGGPEVAATQVPVVKSDLAIVAEGRLVPRESVELAFVSSGQVAEVLVEEGQVVRAGDVLARLSNREQLESNVAAAELELAASRQELLEAQQALETLNEDLPDAQTAALQAVTEARQQVREAERRVNNLNSPAEQVDIDAAWASVVLAKDPLDRAREDYEPYANKPEDNVTRAALLNRMATAQAAYDDAVRRYNNLAGLTGSEFDRSQAEAEFAIATARLELAEQEYELLMKGPHPVDVSLAEARIQTAEMRITSAESGLAAAKSALADLELVATIPGSVVKLDLIPGQQVTPGEPVVQLADFSAWFVETDNLTELEVVNITNGQRTTISPDALPEVHLGGVVDTIGTLFEEKRGDITYTVRIRLDQADPRLRWGMTSGVEFEK